MASTPGTPDAGMLDADEAVASIRSMAPLPGIVDPMMTRTRAAPVFGVMSCFGRSECPPEKLWLIFFPDWVGVDGDVGWVSVDPNDGDLAGGHSVQRP